jgi:hypothetical protein
MDAKATSGSGNEIGKSGSQPKDGVREPIGATLRVSGVIDPALARDTTGTAARAGTGNPTGTAPEPASGTGPEPQPEPIRRGRGRPPGSTTKPKAESGLSEKPLNINGVEKILFSIHTILAAVADTEELAIDEKEAKELAAAIAGVTNEYLIVMSPKTAAWVELGRVCGVIYGPRAVNVWFEAKHRKHNQPPPQPRQQRTEAPPVQQPDFNPTKIILN